MEFLLKKHGFIFSTLYFENVQIIDKDKNFILIEKAAFNLDYLSTFLDITTFDLISIED